MASGLTGPRSAWEPAEKAWVDDHRSRCTDAGRRMLASLRPEDLARYRALCAGQLRGAVELLEFYSLDTEDETGWGTAAEIATVSGVSLADVEAVAAALPHAAREGERVWWDSLTLLAELAECTSQHVAPYRRLVVAKAAPRPRAGHAA
jgi:hypothetical protein